ncbi:molybdate ABC transporter substrate-binding protein [Jannaschia marina]|uniref:molybdate ABC transporter substrate-binding protein n=1 Tax=Jannaschia marina TaxID=2741674 RepID=UPI0015C95948|nr:molybdate ABC transporter substrate-binding protein [Jannaschia marina]
MAARIRSELTRRGLLGAALALAAPTLVRAAEPPLVFAAASLKPAIDDVIAGSSVRVSYGGSGAIARQLAEGGPADVVVLAATDWMDWIGGRGLLRGTPRVVARNGLVLGAAPDVGRVALSAEGITDVLGSGRLAMGDPMSVPAGRYAQQAFETLGLWPTVAERLILTENVRAALAYVARGDVPLAAVYRSDASGAGVSVAAGFPAASHAPIVYPGAVVSDHPEAAPFLDRLAGAGEIFAAHGFAP